MQTLSHDVASRRGSGEGKGPHWREGASLGSQIHPKLQWLPREVLFKVKRREVGEGWGCGGGER